MESPLEAARFLTNSTHRVNVLLALAAARCDRHELRTTTDAAVSMLNRVLADFEDRNWIRRIGRQYEVTALDRFVADRFGTFRDAVLIGSQLQALWR